MNSRKFLMEMFLADARFPDEKFWNKDGSAIHPEPKGPPKGTVGMTHADIGARDSDDAPQTVEMPPLYPVLDDVKKDHPDAYRQLGTILKNLGTTEQDLPEEAFHYDEDGHITVTIPHSITNNGMTHELWWNKRRGSWQYVGI